MEEISFENRYGEKLAGVISKNNDSDIIVVICHGFVGNMNINFFQELLENLNENNFNVLKFDFAGNGESEGEIGDASYLKEREDLDSVLNQLEEKGFKKFCLVGHSMGGGVSIMTASEDQRVKWIVDIAAPAYPNRIKDYWFGEEKVKEALTKGQTTIKTKRYEFIFNKKFFVDLEKADIKGSIKKVKVPLLIIQGTSDERVSLEESEELFILANNPKTMQIISGADHCFIGKEGDLFATIINWCLKWIKE
ncbi:alpha/beta hydrolase [archaeon]|nr:alpha/beta hydrolase [archaeon]MBL7056858.1 alpha/beta hydrolase [Candidatus Woesearchaeota archaeon]